MWNLSVRKSNYLPINLEEFTKFTHFLGQGQRRRRKMGQIEGENENISGI
jgi:hypothetical protein